MGTEKASDTTNGTKHFVPTSGHSLIANSIEHVIAQPDISYIVRGYGDFSIRPSEHFTKMVPGLRALQVPKNVQHFLKWLINQRNWVIESLLQIYSVIGKKQAGFLLYLDPKHLVVLPRVQLPFETETNYTSSTYSKLLQGRSVKIESYNGTAVLPVTFLLPIQYHVMEYNTIPRLNTVFEEELAKKKAYSDSQIKQKVGTIARRTVTKYRLSAEIPDRSERQAQYNEGRLMPYRATLTIEAYLPNH
ncbi:MAG: hypothetical protein AABX33_07275 [Nanoarchaeota archaeon]